MRNVICLFCLSTVVCCAAASDPVRPVPGIKGWILETEYNSYVLAVNPRGGLQHLYWGPRLGSAEEFGAGHFPNTFGYNRGDIANEEYPAWGGSRYEEPCLKATFDDGVRDVFLEYVSHQIRGSVLDVVLKDPKYDLLVTLTYRVYARVGIISRQARIENRTARPVRLESAQSGVWNLPADANYRLTSLVGRFGDEAQVTAEPIRQGLKVLESRRGFTSHDENPWFAIDRGGQATEESGRVWFGALGWSGNWRLSVEQTNTRQVRVTGGFNTFDFEYLLRPGESLETPPFYGGYTEGGFGQASRLLHRLERNELAPHGARARLRPVWYNSWMVYETAVTEANQKALADKAAALGIELFLVDDGWFHLRKKTDAGLGDWFPDTDKFPNGLLPLAQHVKRLGMDFGLWVEPEMVNPNSDLYRAHPDWVLRFPGREPSLSRGQLTLNLARDDVKEYLFSALDRLVSENNIRLFKWDMNRSMADPGWPSEPVGEQRRLWVKYTSNLYEIIDRLRARHPELEFESCASGGGRVDLGILRRVDQIWTSDNVDALDRLRIQEGFSFAYPPKVLMGRVATERTSRANTPLEYRFLVAMMGSLGVSLNLNTLTAEESATARRLIAFYKTIRATTQNGDLYRLASLREGTCGVSQFVAADGGQSVVFALGASQKYYTPCCSAALLRGLDANARYRIQPMHAGKLRESARVATGAYLAGHGLTFNLRGDLDGTAVVLERLP
jgi:alpha-galactosidase